MSFHFQGLQLQTVVTVVTKFKTMITLVSMSVSVLAFPLSNRLPTQTHNPNWHNRFPSSFTFPTSFPNKTTVFGVNPSDSKDPSFFDENGVVNDMEGYLNHLSLEYDSVWDTKPSWLVTFPNYFNKMSF